MRDNNLMFVSVLFAIVAYPAQAEYNKWNGVAFSAVRTISSLVDSPKIIEKSKIYYSQIGTRIEISEGTTKTISIVNYKKQKCWFILPDKKIYYEIGLNKKTRQCGESEIAGFRPETKNPGIFFPRPCYGYKNMKALGKNHVMGRRTSKWHCTGGISGSSVKQWYDPILKMVIREVSDNKITEASKIKLARKPDTHQLLPPYEYTKISLKFQHTLFRR